MDDTLKIILIFFGIVLLFLVFFTLTKSTSNGKSSASILRSSAPSPPMTISSGQYYYINTDVSDPSNPVISGGLSVMPNFNSNGQTGVFVTGEDTPACIGNNIGNNPVIQGHALPATQNIVWQFTSVPSPPVGYGQTNLNTNNVYTMTCNTGNYPTVPFSTGYNESSGAINYSLGYTTTSTSPNAIPGSQVMALSNDNTPQYNTQLMWNVIVINATPNYMECNIMPYVTSSTTGKLYMNSNGLNDGNALTLSAVTQSFFVTNREYDVFERYFRITVS